jgi:hypothetical protein
MAMTLKKAQRSKSFLRLGLASPSGGGKTAGALIIAYGLLKEKYPKLPDNEIWSKIAIIDTERGSGELYVGSEIAGLKFGVYNAITLTPPFEVSKYIQAMDLCEQSGIEVCILDSTTHAWSGEGGLLEQQNNAAKRTNNSWTAWRDITPQHNKFVDKMLQSPMHVIATMRSKQEYVQEKDEQTNKTTVRKLGMEPEQRKGMEYEFTLFLDIDVDHNAYGAKDRTTLFDKKTFKITANTGKQLMDWLNNSVDTAPVVVATAHPASKETGLDSLKLEVIALCKELGGKTNANLMATLKRYTPSGNPNEITDEAKLGQLRAELLDEKEERALENIPTNA